MTDTTIALRRPGVFRRFIARLIDWLNEEVAITGPTENLSLRDYADLPTHHPK